MWWCICFSAILSNRPTLSFPLVCPQACSLCLHLHCCPANRFISTIFPCTCFNIRYWAFSFWFTSLCIIDSRFIHLIRTDSDAFIFCGWVIFIVYMYHRFCIHSSVDGHLGCFYVLSSVLSLSRVWLIVTPWTAARQASLSITNSRAYSNSCPSSWWRHPDISSSVVPFSSCRQSSPASRSFLMSQFFTSGGQSIGASASASVLPVNIHDWFPLRLVWSPCGPRDSREPSRMS